MRLGGLLVLMCGATASLLKLYLWASCPKEALAARCQRLFPGTPEGTVFGLFLGWPRSLQKPPLLSCLMMPLFMSFVASANKVCCFSFFPVMAQDSISSVLTSKLPRVHQVPGLKHVCSYCFLSFLWFLWICGDTKFSYCCLNMVWASTEVNICDSPTISNLLL